MLSTMQDVPLTVSRILTHGSTVHGESQVITWTGRASRTGARFAEIGAPGRTAGARAARRARRRRRRARRHADVEQRRARRGVLRDPLHGRGAAHPQPPAARRAAGVDRQPRRRPGRPRQRLAAAAARPAAAAPARPSSTSSSSGPGDRSVLDGAPARVHEYEELIAGPPDELRLAGAGRAPGRRHVLHLRHHRRPQGRASTPTARSTCTRCRSTCAESMGAHRRATPRCPSCRMFHVNAWGLPHADVHDRRRTC